GTPGPWHARNITPEISVRRPRSRHRLSARRCERRPHAEAPSGRALLRRARAGAAQARARRAGRPVHDARGGGRPANATRDRRRLGAVRDRGAMLAAQDEADAFVLAHRAHLVVDHAARERDATHDLFGDVTAAARLGPRDPEPTGWMQAVRDVGEPAL